MFRRKAVKELVKEELAKKVTIAKTDTDLARLKEMGSIMANLQASSPQQTQNPNQFFAQMLQFEQMKQGIMDIENKKLDKLYEQIEAEGGENQDDINPKQILDLISNLKAQKTPQFTPPTLNLEGKPPLPPATPTPPLPELEPLEPLPELDVVTKAACATATKKIPKIVKKAFLNKTPLEKEAIITQILENLEKE